MNLALSRRFIKEYSSLSEDVQRLCDSALERLPGAFGHPRHHSGLGIRALRRNLYECRVSQAVRIGFTRHGDTLLLHTVGNHETMRAWLRSAG